MKFKHALMNAVAVAATCPAGAYAQTALANPTRPDRSNPAEGQAFAAMQAPAPENISPADPAQPVPSAQLKSPAGLDEIVVTAQKRAQNVQDVPIAVSAVLGTQLTAAGIVNTEQLNVAVPAVSLRTTSGSFQPFIRGIGTSAVNIENPVSLYIDGVYYPSQREGLRDLVDIEQIAVLKGPQGTLFGRNATGGVIQITTKAPSHTFGAQVSAGFDNYETLRTSFYATGGLTDALSASLATNYSRQGEGWGRNLTTGRDTYKLFHMFSARGKLRFEAGGSTDIMLIADYLDRRDNLGPNPQPYPGTTARLPGVGPLTSVYDTYIGVDSENSFRGGGVSLSIDQDLGFAKLLSISAFRRGKATTQFDGDGSPLSVIEVSQPNVRNRSFTQEVQLISPDDSAVHWVAGLFYIDSKSSQLPLTRFLSGPLAPLPTSAARNDISATEQTRSVAPFGQLDFTILPETQLTLGARYTYEKRTFDGALAATLNNGTVIPNLIPPIKGDSITIKKPTWRIALDHSFTPDVLGYLSYNRGIKSGGFNIANPANPPYLPERLDAYEAGLKTELLGRRLRLNGALFYYDYANVQVIQLFGITQTVANGAKAELYGLDVDFEAKLAPGLRVSGGAVLLHANFTRYPNAVFSTPSATGGSIIGVGDASGNRLPLAQKFNGTLSVDYSWPTSSGEFAVNMTNSYNGNYFFESDNYTAQNAYVISNISTSWTSPGRGITAQFWVRNLFDKKVISQAAAQNFIVSTTYSNAPRTYGVTTTVMF